VALGAHAAMVKGPPVFRTGRPLDPNRPLERDQVEVKELTVVGAKKLALGKQVLRCLTIRR